MSNRTILSTSDEWATPVELFEKLCDKHDIEPKIDIAATEQNTKCKFFIDKYEDALFHEYGLYNKDIWCNAPNSMTKDFVLKNHEQWKKHNVGIIQLATYETTARKYFDVVRPHVEIHLVRPRPKFIHDDQEKPQNATREYCVIIWRRRG